MFLRHCGSWPPDTGGQGTSQEVPHPGQSVGEKGRKDNAKERCGGAAAE
jgi:hypothetical protein